ncbi:Hypothetical protein NGAL_HAMBI1145_09550 [Neorhizobium galegae bv. officinalis]|uniref:Uncharacterized protein n=1 Tax=Neorhizobium galegae bv. officinalis TaxID=323656 RepID=A0A0T7FAW5_NEOGA|nr:hypothetical protein [Neorhizobium galegae]CDZ32184.1 Hypothetical protein NGAL_HAMBI1145_09550 [Neorhizobium galegae bv. officinalis]
MIDRTFENILNAMANEFQLDGHEVIEAEGVQFARLSIDDESGRTHLAEINLTRIADAIARRVA